VLTSLAEGAGIWPKLTWLLTPDPG
jgi:hypothetical protein